MKIVVDFPPLADNQIAHWLEHNLQAMHDPKHASEQDQKLLQMQVSICTELMARRHADTLQPEDAAKDAERYRWLRERHDAGDVQAFVYGAHGKLDAYIDAAMSNDTI